MNYFFVYIIFLEKKFEEWQHRPPNVKWGRGINIILTLNLTLPKLTYPNVKF